MKASRSARFTVQPFAHKLNIIMADSLLEMDGCQRSNRMRQSKSALLGRGQQTSCRVTVTIDSDNLFLVEHAPLDQANEPGVIFRRL